MHYPEEDRPPVTKAPPKESVVEEIARLRAEVESGRETIRNQSHEITNLSRTNVQQAQRIQQLQTDVSNALAALANVTKGTA